MKARIFKGERQWVLAWKTSIMRVEAFFYYDTKFQAIAAKRRFSKERRKR